MRGINPYEIEFGYILLVWYQYIIYIFTTLTDGVKKRFHPQLNDLDNMLASAFNPQFKLSWLKARVKRKVITERMIKRVNEKERLHADGNTHRIIEEDGQENSDFFRCLA